MQPTRAVRVLGAVAVALVTVAAPAARADDLHWRESWGKVSAPEYFVMVASAGIGATTNYAPVAKYRWGRNALDEAVRGALRLESPAARVLVRNLGEVFFYGLMAYPIVVDGLVAALPRDSEVAGQTIAIDVESLAVGAMASMVLEHVAGRERPFLRECRKRTPGTASECALSPEEEHQSFPSGHTIMAFTGAGLMCAHHANLPLYGGGAPDAVACALGLAGASFNGLARIMSDRHYFTDVLAGAAVGLGAGLALPIALHYAHGNEVEDENVTRTTSAMVPLSPGPRIGFSGQF